MLSMVGAQNVSNALNNAPKSDLAGWSWSIKSVENAILERWDIAWFSADVSWDVPSESHSNLRGHILVQMRKEMLMK